MYISMSIHDFIHISNCVRTLNYAYSYLPVFMFTRFPIYPYSYLAIFLSIHILIYHSYFVFPI